MRTNNRVTFIKVEKGGYDWRKGENLPDKEARETRPAFVSELSLDRSKQLFGEFEQGRKVVRLLHPYKDKADRVEIDGKSYRVLATRQKSTVFICEVTSV